MQNTSELYNSILLKPYDVETKLDIYTADGKTLVGSYGEDVLVSCMTTGKLFSSPSVGAAVGREIDVKMLMPNETLPRMAMLKPFVRIRYGADISEWIQKGVYFIDTRSTDKQTGVLTIHGYDAMLKTEQLYCGSGDVGQWPRTMAAVVNDICSKIGVTLDSRTAISSTYNCQLDTTFSMREYLSHIAAAHAGVFMMTDTGQMRLVPLKHDSTAVADLGQDVDLLGQSPALAAFDRVVINVSQESIYAYPVNETTGRTLELECRWGSDAMAQAIHGLVNGFVYQPYETGNALISPAVEVGDAVTIDGKLCGIYQMNITFGAMMGVKLAAPADDEVDHEYHYTSTIEKVKKQLATATAELRVLDDSIQGIVEDVEGNLSEFQQTAEEITTKVEKLEDDVTTAQSQITQTAESITAEVQARKDSDAALESKIEQQADSITLQVIENLDGEYYAKQSAVEITADGIDISSTGSINLESGASFTVDSPNFKVNENGYLTASGASLPSAAATNLTVYDAITFKDSSGNTETMSIDSTSRYNGLINLGNNLKLYGVSSGAVIYSNGGNFQVFTTASGVSRIYLNGQYIESFDAITGTAVFG